jgi:acetyl esterase/lipase
VRAITDIEYGQTPEKRLLLDIFLPAELPAAPLPLIVNIHGGGWAGGSKDFRGDLRQIAQGFAYASISYRLSQEATFPAQIHDCKGAIRFLRAHAAEYHLDPGRIGLWGASAGGHLVALLGASAGIEELEGEVGGNLAASSRVQAVCDFCGPTDLLLYFKLGGRKKYGMIIGLVDQLLGGPLGKKRALARLANPLAFVTPQAPPFLIVHGDQDEAVPHQHGVALHEALTKAGVESTLLLLKGMGHFLAGPEIDAAVDRFFSRHLK